MKREPRLSKSESEGEDEYEHVKEVKKMKVGYEGGNVNQYLKQVEENLDVNDDIADLFAGRDIDIPLPTKTAK